MESACASAFAAAEKPCGHGFLAALASVGQSPAWRWWQHWAEKRALQVVFELAGSRRVLSVALARVEIAESPDLAELVKSALQAYMNVHDALSEPIAWSIPRLENGKHCSKIMPKSAGLLASFVAPWTCRLCFALQASKNKKAVQPGAKPHGSPVQPVLPQRRSLWFPSREQRCTEHIKHPQDLPMPACIPSLDQLPQHAQVHVRNLRVAALASENRLTLPANARPQWCDTQSHWQTRL